MGVLDGIFLCSTRLFQMLEEISRSDETRDRCIILDIEGGMYKIDRHGTMYCKATSVYDPAFQDELRSPDNYYVYDSRTGAAVPRRTVRAKALIAAPLNKVHYKKQWKEPKSIRLFMPVWGLDELLLCRVHCYPHITAESVARMHSLVGGVPRTIFAATESAQANALQTLRRAVKAMPLNR